MPKEITLEMLYEAKESREHIIEKGDWFGDAVADVLFNKKKMFENRSDSNASRLIFNTSQRNGFWKDYLEEGGTTQTRAKTRFAYWRSKCQCCGEDAVVTVQGGIFASARIIADVVAAAYWGKDHNIFGTRDTSKPNPSFAITYFLDCEKALCKECALHHGEMWKQQYKEFLSLSGVEKAECIKSFVNKEELGGESCYGLYHQTIHHPIIGCGFVVDLFGEPGRREVSRLHSINSKWVWESDYYKREQEKFFAGIFIAQQEQRRRDENIKKAKEVKARFSIEEEEKVSTLVKIENYILECILANPNDLQIALNLISPNDFTTPRNKVIYEQIVWMSNNRRPISTSNVIFGLRTIGKLQKAGGEYRVMQLETIGIENEKKRKPEGRYNSDDLLQSCISLKKLQKESGKEADPTKGYIKKYCLPTDEKPDDEEISYIISATDLDEKQLRNHLKAMSYTDFQKTKYWKSVLL